jgi:hypothetical protein
MSYADLLKDRRWQKKRLEVLEASGWECQSCGSSDDAVQLHVHHRRYRRGAKPWEYGLDELEALCETCHTDATVAFRLLDSAVEMIKMASDTAAAAEAAGMLEARATPNGKIRVVTFEHAYGIGSTCKATAQQVLDRRDSDGCVVPVDILIDMNGKK